MTIQHQTMRVTPAMAAQWLENNTDNFRSISRARVDAMAIDMKEGRWDSNGQTIVFNGDGTLLDGQHRLSAVVKSNLPISFLIVRGVKSALNIDRGQQRSTGQWLAHSNIKWSSTVAAVSRSALAHDSAYWTQKSFSNVTRAGITHSAIAEYGQINGEAIGELCKIADRFHLSKLIPLSIAVSVPWIGTRTSDHHMAIDFLERLGLGTNIDSRHPIYYMREALIAGKHDTRKKFSLWQMRMLLSKTWNLLADRRTDIPSQTWRIMWNLPNPTLPETITLVE